MSTYSGIQVSIEGLHGVADQLEGAAGTLHGHADMIEGVSIPAAAFGAHEAAAAQFVQDQQGTASTVRGVATRVQGHGADARGAAIGYVSQDSAGAEAAHSVQA